MNIIKLGMIGISKGNGHPFSFASIINGFNNEEMKNSGWDIIYNYLRERDNSEFGFNQVKITHVWTQNKYITNKLAKAARIENIVLKLDDMIPKVNGVIIARDDYQNHFKIASKFLEEGKYVFVDKPLSLNIHDIKYFSQYIKNGKLMSCSGMRYARELDYIRANINNFGKIKLIRGTIVNDLEKYGIHLLDGIFGIIDFHVESVLYIKSNHDSLILKNQDNSLICIDALGKTQKTFQFDFWSDKKRFHAEVFDNFSMFRRTIYHFIRMIRTGKPAIDLNHIVNMMKILIAANISKKEKREVKLSELDI
jgi:predicted dehydrogenase